MQKIFTVKKNPVKIGHNALYYYEGRVCMYVFILVLSND